MATRQAMPGTIDEYIAAFSPEVRAILRKIRRTVGKAAPDAQETISYRIPSFRLNGMLVHFAAFKAHIGFYPPVRGDAKLVEAVSRYAGEKGNEIPARRTDPVRSDRTDRAASRAAESRESGGEGREEAVSGHLW